MVNLTSPRLLESQKRNKCASLKWLLVSIQFDVICVSCVCIYIYMHMHIYIYISIYMYIRILASYSNSDLSKEV